jgi:HAD superfamily hydrolase (TIGR01509 family)
LPRGRDPGVRPAVNVQAISPGSVDALLFDLGGVIIEVDFDRAFSHWAACSNHSPEEIRSRFSFDESYKRHERGEVSAGEYFDSLRTSLGIDLSDAQFADGWNAIFVREIPGIAGLLRRATARLPLYAFSNSNPIHQRVWSSRFSNVLGIFKTIFVSSDIGQRKPEPGAFRTVAKRIGVGLHRIAFFDDTVENIDGALAVGLRAVHVKSLADIEASLTEILA